MALKKMLSEPRAHKMRRVLNLLLFGWCFFAACSKPSYHPELVPYMIEERMLKSRISVEQGLSDSLTALQKRYDIDLEHEKAVLKDHPELWVRLLKELQRGK